AAQPGRARPAQGAADGPLMAHIPSPRLLPLTIFALSGLLAMKSVTLVRAAVSGPDQSAPAAATGAPAPHVAAPTTQGNRGAVPLAATQPPPAMPPAIPPTMAPAPA